MSGHRAVISFQYFSIYSSVSGNVPYISPTFPVNSEKTKKWKRKRRSRNTCKSHPAVRKASISSTCTATEQSPGCGYPLTPSRVTVNLVDLNFSSLPKRTRSQLDTLPNNSRGKTGGKWKKSAGCGGTMEFVIVKTITNKSVRSRA